MMQDKGKYTLFAALLVLGLATLACGLLGSEEIITPTLTISVPSEDPCGDGICDAVEKKNPVLCPQDCPEPVDTPYSQITVQPNIVFILTDDLDYAAIEYMDQLKTFIADQGTTLSNFLISMPLCCPSRASILRGQYGHNTQIMGNDLPFGGFSKFSQLGEEESTCATWLQNAGYRTMLAGKYLNAFPEENDLMHIPPGWIEWYSPIQGEAYTQYDYTLNENGRQVVYGNKAEDYGTDVYAQKTIEFIQRSAEEGQPFFAHVSVYAPHWPTTPAPRHAKLFSDVQAPRTPNFNEEDVSDKPSYISNLPLLTEENIARIDEDWRQRLRSMQAVDEMIGAIVDTLESTGQLNNTFIFFTSDNGYHFGNHRQLLGKTAPYDEEIRVTMIVRGPGVPIGKTLDHLTGNIDLGPTWAEIAGVTLPDFVDGRSLMPLLGQNSPAMSEWRQSFLIEHAPFKSPMGSTGMSVALAQRNTPIGLMEPPDPEDEFSSGTLAALRSGSEALPYRGIRTADYLYVEYPTDEKELYDLRNDPYQLDNIVTTADRELVAILAARLDELASCSGEACRAIEDKPFIIETEVTAPPQPVIPEHDTLTKPLIYYLGYATEENMKWIETFDVDVLTRGFLLFLNSNDSWFSSYQARMELLQEQDKQFLVALQAAVLVEDGDDIPRLGPNDPTLEFPMDTISEWEEFACHTSEGLALKDKAFGFSHACINNANFQEFLKGKLRALIDLGVDGVHIDELQTRYFTKHEGYCDACMTGFRNYLAGKYTHSELNSRYNITNIETFDFQERLSEEGNQTAPPENPLHKEWWLFQLSNLFEVERDIFSSTRSYALSQGTEFVITSNAFEPESNPEHVIEMTMTDYTSIGTGMTIHLRKEGKIISSLRIPPNYSYIPLYRMAQSITPDKPVTLFIDGPGGTNVMNDLPETKQKDIIRWMFSEAYSTGARFHVPYPSLDYYAPLNECEQYVRFIRDNAKVYEDVEHLTDVGVLFSYASEIWDYWASTSPTDINHSLQWYGLTQALTDMSVQYEVVFVPDGNIISDNLTLNNLLKYDTLIIPWAYSMNDKHVKLMEEYIQRGNKLIIVGDYAIIDEEKNPNLINAVESLKKMEAIVVPKLNFESYLNNPQGSSSVPVLEVLNDLIPNRLITVNDNAVTMQLNRKDDKLYVHLINTDLKESGFLSQTDLKIRISLPTDLKISDTDAIYISPDLPEGESSFLPVTRENGAVELNIPNLEVYGVVVITITE